jgi:hypothetical protein
MGIQPFNSQIHKQQAKIHTRVQTKGPIVFPQKERQNNTKVLLDSLFIYFLRVIILDPNLCYFKKTDLQLPTFTSRSQNTKPTNQHLLTRTAKK